MDLGGIFFSTEFLYVKDSGRGGLRPPPSSEDCSVSALRYCGRNKQSETWKYYTKLPPQLFLRFSHELTGPEPAVLDDTNACVFNCCRRHHEPLCRFGRRQFLLSGVWCVGHTELCVCYRASWAVFVLANILRIHPRNGSDSIRDIPART